MSYFKSGRVFLRATAIALVVLAVMGVPAFAQEGTEEMSTQPTIILVHGAWADGSSWSKTIPLLQAEGYNVLAPQFPHTSLADNVARLQQVLNDQPGPFILAGHSYGGQILSALGTEAAASSNVVGLVYIAAFGLDEGEAIGALLASGPVTPALAHLHVDAQGFAWLPQDDFVTYFASDVDPAEASVMWAVQQPLTVAALEDVMTDPTWKSVPSYYLVATNDEAIPPDAQRLFAGRMGATTVEVESSHVAMYSHPQETVDLIIQAAEAIAVTE